MPASRRRTLLLLALVCGFTLLLALPFLGQAFHIDDAIFWDFAKNNLRHPFSLHLDDYHLMGEDFSRWRDTHPPLDSLYLSLVMVVTGSDSEVPLHAGFLLFPLVGGVAMDFLARRFTRRPPAAALALLATPAVMTLSHTLMADVPMMSFWIAATACYVHGVDRGDRRLLAAASLLVTVDLFTGYQALALLVLLPLYPLARGKLSRASLVPLLLPVLAFGLYTLYNLYAYGEPPRFAHANGTSFNWGHVLDRLQGMLLQVGGTSLFPPLLLAIFSARRRRWVLAPFMLALAAACGYYGNGLAGLRLAFYTVMLAAALAVIVTLAGEGARQFARARRGRSVDLDFVFLSAWLAFMFAATVMLLPHAPAKYTLVFLPPLVLLAFRELDALPLSRRALDATAALVVVTTLAAGTLVSVADYRLAASYRDFAGEVAAARQSGAYGGEVWFVGEWGFRHYMEAAGFHYLSRGNESPAAGDIIVRPSVADWPLAPAVRDRMQVAEVREVEWGFPLRLMGRDADAGFYGTYWGLLPYSPSRTPLERFTVYRVGAAAGAER